MSDIYKGFINNSSTVSAFLDIKEVFDNIVLIILIEDLKNIGIPARIRIFILNLISVRQLHFVTTEPNPFFHSSAPLKDLLLVLFYLISTSKILSIIYTVIRVFYFMRTTLSFILLLEMHRLLDSVQTSLNQIAKFLKNRGLDLSPEKSQ